MDDAECGRSVDVAVLGCRIVLRVEVEAIGEERGGVLKNGIVAIGGCRGLLDEELTYGTEGRCELCDQLWSDPWSTFFLVPGLLKQ